MLDRKKYRRRTEPASFKGRNHLPGHTSKPAPTWQAPGAPWIVKPSGANHGQRHAVPCICLVRIPMFQLSVK